MANILDIQKHVVNSSPLDKIFLFYGKPGTRKTTVALGDPEHTLLGAYEIGYKFIPGVYAVNLTNWHALKDVIRQLNSPEAKEKYKTFVIDTIGLAYKACVSYICNLKGVTEIGQIPFGQGYALAKNEFEKTIGSISQLGYGLIMIAHSDELMDEKAGISIKVDIDKRPSTVIKGMADFILYTSHEVKEGTENEMTVYAYSQTNSSNMEAKKRARFFPNKFEFTYNNLMAALEYAVKKQDEFYNTTSTDKPDFTVFQETEVDLKGIQEEIIGLANKLVKQGLQDRVNKILLDGLNGIRVTQTTKAHLPALYQIRDEFLDLEKNL